MLRKNRRALAAEFRVFLRDDILPMTETARGFSIAQDPAELGLFSYEIAEFFQSLDQSDPRPIVISAEDLSGHMPGRHGTIRYETAPKLMATVAEIAALILPQTAEISFFFTTRAPTAWVRSCHAQHLRATRMTDDLATYERAFLPHADLTGITAQIRAAVAPHALITAALEDSAPRRFGPASALFDLMQPSAPLRRSLAAIPAQNTALPVDINEQLRHLNQSDLDDPALKAAKRALLSNARNPEQ
ncbi:MAG: hypothetical protein Q9M48_07275 [Rhodobacterales bacterium]|nr:hypothetical protein [Rhodobacterales bacterium]